jgi:hypothetical protein
MSKKKLYDKAVVFLQPVSEWKERILSLFIAMLASLRFS